MTPAQLLDTAITPALAALATVGIADTPRARTIMLAIALQESGLTHRRQVSADGKESGPATSFWQFEKGGGCRGVLGHAAVAARMRKVCIDFNVDATEQALWEAMRYQDIVAAAAARLLLFTLPAALPATADEGWKQYLAAWRPGKPHPATWPRNWDEADRVVRGHL
jgi:hypothetical protein